MALWWVGETALGALIGKLVDRMTSPKFLDYFRGRNKHSDLDKLVKKLKLVLESVTALLDDAEEKQMRDKPGVKGWLDELQDAAYDADDLLDDIEYEALKLKVEADHHSSSANTTEVRNFPNKKRKFRGIFSSSSSSSDPDMESKIKKILERLEDCVKQKDSFGLKEGTVGEKQWRRLPSTSLVDESEIYGRDEDKDIVMKLVMSDDVGGKESYCVIPIVGMGGVGKTTLAKEIFNDGKLKDMFELKVWVCVSEDFDVFRVTKNILEAVTSCACDVTDFNLLQVKLKESLARKKFLIVLDDIWNENQDDLDVLKMPFKYGPQGSKIIVTTRSEMVASIMGNGQIHNLTELTENDCWQLFVKNAFGSFDFINYPDLVEIGKEIVKKCKGLPLAAKTLGRLLCTTRDVEKWEGIKKSDIWELTNEQSSILPALRLSYYYLPSHLKRCFAYCSLFPKDFVFDKENLVLLWMAANLLEYPKGNKRIEEIGNEYFDDLVSRSLFQRLSGPSPFTGNKSFFVMHDLIHDLAKFVSGDYCLFLEDANSNGVVRKTRHLASSGESITPYIRSNSVFKAINLRTFLLNLIHNYKTLHFNHISDKILHDLLSKLRYLRVLSLRGHKKINRLPDSIGELRHLRYLDLSFMDISILPESICMLYNLQVLKLYGCWNLKKLPEHMHHLINLRYLDVMETALVKMPKQLGSLKGLQRLSTFIVGKDSGNKIGELRELSSLQGGLHIRKLENVVNVEDASNQAKLMEKKYLTSLSLEWSVDSSLNNCRQERGVLDMLLPNETLKELEILGYSDAEFSNWVGKDSFRNMVSIRLSKCRNCSSLPPLGQLPLLKILDISEFHAVVNVGQEFYGISSPFPSLETLRFNYMSSWKQWRLIVVENRETFPRLKELEIRNCHELIGNLPPNLPKLTELKIDNCELLDSSLPRMPSVRKLEFGGCENLLMKIGSLFEALKQMEANLLHLDVKNCSSLMSIGCPPTTLELLNISNCEKLELPFSLLYESLKELNLSKCNYSLKSIPLDSFPKLEKLSIQEFESLESLTVANGPCQDVSALSYLRIQHCPNFVSFPNGGLPCPRLISLVICDCKKLESLPKRTDSLLPSLDYLCIINCPEIELSPEGGLPNNLSSLYILSCNKLVASRLTWNLQRLQNLVSFWVSGTDTCEEELFLEEGVLPPTITELSIISWTRLKALDKNGLQQLTSLNRLSISNCPELQSLPRTSLPTSLKTLHIDGCPLLENKEYWTNIPHTCDIIINGELVS